MHSTKEKLKKNKITRGEHKISQPSNTHISSIEKEEEEEESPQAKYTRRNRNTNGNSQDQTAFHKQDMMLQIKNANNKRARLSKSHLSKKETSEDSPDRHTNAKRQEPVETSENIIRRSSRHQKEIYIRTLSLVSGEPASPSYGVDRKVDDKHISDFVEKKIKPGYQWVFLPTDPQSHSILVNVSKTLSHPTKKEGVEIVDWGGDKNRYLGETVSKNRRRRKEQEKIYKQWKYYTKLIHEIERQHGPVTYIKVDDDLYQQAKKESDRKNGQGGCSDYLHRWIPNYMGAYTMGARE
jgi:hypothetical protein